MMRMALHVKYNDGSGADVVASAPDFIAFERHFDKSMTTFGETVRIEYVLWLTWMALHRRGLADDDFEAWADRVDTIDFGDTAESEIVPLASNQPTG